MKNTSSHLNYIFLMRNNQLQTSRGCTKENSVWVLQENVKMVKHIL